MVLWSKAVSPLTACLLLLSALAGCAGSMVDHRPPPAERFVAAELPGFPDARVWSDFPPADVAERGEPIIAQALARAKTSAAPPQLNLLAISGGSSDGAYGAGVMNGWTERGDRPVFDIVSGVSTGALIAPFAFLGPEYDANLKRVFTQTSTAEVAEFKVLAALFGALSLADSSPLRDRITENYTDAMIDAIGVEHAKGRRLIVSTTNLDARRQVIWNMGAIAQRGGPEAYKLFRDVLAASAAIPGAFQPSFFTVTLDGARYTEMHVDGGVTSSVFVLPQWFNNPRFSPEYVTGGVNIYIIQNNKVSPDYGPSKPKLLTIAGDAISELIRTQSRGDLIRIYSVALARDYGFHLTSVPESFNAEAKEDFDTEYMSALFKVGYQRALQKDLWLSAPPLPAALEVESMMASP